MYSQYKGGGPGSERWLKRRQDRGRPTFARGHRQVTGNVPKPQMQGGPAGINMNVDPAKRMISPPQGDAPSFSAYGGAMPALADGGNMMPPQAVPTNPAIGGKGGKGGPPQDLVHGARFMGGRIPGYGGSGPGYMQGMGRPAY